MPRKKKSVSSDYNPIIIDLILNWIKDTGDEKLACEKTGVGYRTFQGWKKNYKDFAAKVEASHGVFRDNLPVSQRAKAKEALNRYLSPRETVQNTEEVFYDKSGKIANRKVITKKDIAEVPRWAIERALGTGTSELDAVRLLVQSGWLDNEIIDQIAQKLDIATEDIKKILK